MCRDCKKGVNLKVALSCGHQLCRNCLMQFVHEKLLEEQPYEYSASCSACSEVVRISTFPVFLESITLDCGCEWTEIGEKHACIQRFDGSSLCECRQSHLLEVQQKTYSLLC